MNDTSDLITSRTYVCFADTHCDNTATYRISKLHYRCTLILFPYSCKFSNRFAENSESSKASFLILTVTSVPAIFIVL